MLRLSALGRRIAVQLRPLKTEFRNSTNPGSLNRGYLTRARHLTSLAPNSHRLSMSKTPEQFGNFDLIKRVKLDFTDVVISKWKSRTTGLSVVHLDYEGERSRPYSNITRS